jgi:hypothetical protein
MPRDEAVIRRQDAVHTRAVRVVGREQVVHAGLGNVAASQRSVPTLSMPVWPDLMTIEPSSISGCRTRHRAVVEEEGVVVVRRTAEELDVPRLGVREASFRPLTSEFAWMTPTPKLSKVV